MLLESDLARYRSVLHYSRAVRCVAGFHKECGWHLTPSIPLSAWDSSLTGIATLGEGEGIVVIHTQGRRGPVLRPLRPWAISLIPLAGALYGARAPAAASALLSRQNQAQ